MNWQACSLGQLLQGSWDLMAWAGFISGLVCGMVGFSLGQWKGARDAENEHHMGRLEHRP